MGYLFNFTNAGSQHTTRTELQFTSWSYEHVLTDGSVHSLQTNQTELHFANSSANSRVMQPVFRTNRALTVLVLLQHA